MKPHYDVVIATPGKEMHQDYVKSLIKTTTWLLDKEKHWQKEKEKATLRRLNQRRTARMASHLRKILKNLTPLSVVLFLTLNQK